MCLFLVEVEEKIIVYTYLRTVFKAREEADALFNGSCEG